MTLSRDQEERVREALGALVDATPRGVEFEDLLVGDPTKQPKPVRWPKGPLAFGAAFVVVMVIGAVSLLLTGGDSGTGGVLDEPIMSDATPVEVEDVENSLPDGFVSHPDDDWYSIPAGDFRAFVLIREGEPPHVYATSCDVLDAVELPDGWDASCKEMTVDGVRVRGVFGYNQELSENTYADEFGFLWYATDCPNADVLLSAESADALPNIDSTAREHVEAIAQTSPEYRVIPRNGWVWVRTADRGYRVEQVEDFMVERTIESADQCPPIPAHTGEGVPVAYRIIGSQPESLGRLPDGRAYVLGLDPALGEARPEAVYAAIEVNVDEAPFTGDDIGCPTCFQPVFGITTFYPGSDQEPNYEDGVYRASSGDWTMEIKVYDDILTAWGADSLEAALIEHIRPVDAVDGLPAFELTGPFQWTEDDDVPHFMEVLYPGVVVRRGCDESSIACSPSRALQVVPLHPEDWNPEWTIRISDTE